MNKLNIDDTAALQAHWFYDKEKVEFIPAEFSHYKGDCTKLYDQIFKHYGPKNPILPPNSFITAMGSCFAERIRRFLHQRHGKSCNYVHTPAALNNSFAVRGFINWVLTGDVTELEYSYDKDENDQAIKKWQGDREAQLRGFNDSSAFLITFGLSEVWKDITNGKVFWRGVPSNIYDRTKHVCCRSTVQENTDNVKFIINILQKYYPQKPVIVTLSPVPLNATPLGESIWVADCVSKSTLRIAIHEAIQNTSNVYYWPSFEVIRWLGAQLPFAAFGADNCARHPIEPMVQYIVNQFVNKFYKK